MSTYCNPEDLRVGTTYRVELNDCCIEGMFTSRLQTMIWEDAITDPYPEMLEFRNGVVLTNFSQCIFQEEG